MSAPNKASRRRRAGIVIATVLALIVGGAFLLPLASYVVTDVVAPAVAQELDAGKNPHANYWRAVREGNKGYTAASGPYTVPVLIQNGGEIFREVRNGPIASIAPWVLAGILALIALYHFLIGPQRLQRPPSGRKVERWSLGERVMHWYVAVLFIILAVTGLSLLFGRAMLIPVIGLSAFSAYAEFSKMVHNYLGPFFLAGVIVEVAVWMRYNLFGKEDFAWLARAGGMLGGKHPHAGRTNGGEKVWFWFIATGGLIGVCATGLILDFPIFGQTREAMQITQILHAIFATLWIAIALGHIYLGVWGTPGALEGMTTGRVSEEWMQHHHDRWYEKMEKEGAGGRAPEGSAPGSSAHAPPRPT
jgi:formate dehydrogenase subunit gamma